MGPNKIEKMGLSRQWIARVKRMEEAYKILRFEVLKSFHESWIETIKNLCCEEERAAGLKLGTFVDNIKSSCKYFFHYCSCKCH